MAWRNTTFFSSRAAHVLVLVIGTAFLLTAAFHGNIWFDESYSVAIASHSFADIWNIGSSDVHPVLFYWALHLLSLLTGESIVAFRLFALAGTVALALLGYTHLRKDFGWKVGLAFSFLALFTPYVAYMAVQIRMYSWVTFTIMLCAIYAYRIYRALCGGTVGKGDKTNKTKAINTPMIWWVVFFLSSLASAYLHYFGTLCAFSINLMLLIALLHNFRSHKRALLVFGFGIIVQIILYIPWLIALESQLSVISNTYWINFIFPTTFIELAFYPIYTSQIAFALQGNYGLVPQVVIFVSVLVLVLSLAVFLFRSFRAKRFAPFERKKTSRKNRRGVRCIVPAWAAALILYSLVVVLALAFSLTVSPMLYHRYLFVAIGPLLFVFAFALSRVKSKSIMVAFCLGFLALTLTNQVLLVSDDYNSENTAPLEYFEETTKSDELVLSSDIGIEGVTAVMYPDISQLYLDWQPGNWGLSYEAYAPTLHSIKSWDQAFSDYRGNFVVLGMTSDGSTPRAVVDIQNIYGAQMIEMKTFYRPYERTYFTIAALAK